MKLAFYKAFQSGATYVDKIIAVGTFGRYSHVEMIFSDGESFSISPRDAGSRYKEIHYSEKNWDIIEIETSEHDEKLIRAIIDANYMDKEYDYVGAFFSTFSFCIQKEKKLFCSEVVVDILRRLPKFDHFNKGCQYSPNGLNKTIKRKNICMNIK